LLCLRNARAFPLLPAALASVPFGFVLVRVRVRLLLVETSVMRFCVFAFLGPIRTGLRSRVVEGCKY